MGKASFEAKKVSLKALNEALPVVAFHRKMILQLLPHENGRRIQHSVWCIPRGKDMFRDAL